MWVLTEKPVNVLIYTCLTRIGVCSRQFIRYRNFLTLAIFFPNYCLKEVPNKERCCRVNYDSQNLEIRAKEKTSKQEEIRL